MQSSDNQKIIDIERQRHFVRAMSKSIDGRPVTQSESVLLNAIFESLLRGEDVSELIGVRPPHTRRLADPIFIALHYLCLTKLMHETPAVAWHVVGDAWGLSKRNVRWVIADNRAPALRMLWKTSATPEALLRLCERHARGAQPARRRSGLETPTSGGSDSLRAT